MAGCGLGAGVEPWYAGGDHSRQGLLPDDLHKQFGFMSGNAWIYSRRGKGIAVRRYTADYLRRANDWLWDAKTDADRMALAPAIAK